jgi:geranylgeranyl pyrophosphate synthase/predicted secreted hydrolase
MTMPASSYSASDFSAAEPKSSVHPSTGPCADREAARPPDWPGPGAIELSVQDLPHASATLEWWYLNCHLKTLSGRELSVFAAFFRQAADVRATGEFEYAHSVSWALCEPDRQRYWPKVAVDARAPALGLKKLGSGGQSQDDRLSRALRQVLERGKVPGPTRMFEGDARVESDELDLSYGRDRLSKTATGAYRLELHDERHQIDCKLVFTPQKPPIRQGDHGVIHGVADESMFYYFVPRCDVSGTITVAGETEAVVEGSGWYDHEFGAPPRSALAESPAEASAAETSWRWTSVQLDGGTDVSVFLITRRATGEVLDNWTVLCRPDGSSETHRGAVLETLSTWQSTRSFVEYPTKLRLVVASADLDLELTAAFEDQEVLTVISDPGFWEGRVNARGTLDGRAVHGRGWLECKGFRFANVGAFFEAVGKQVRGRLAALLPRNPESESLSNLVVRGDGVVRRPERYTDGVPSSTLVRALVDPIREIADRGGKGWRSYAALACIDAVGGDSRKFVHWLAMPELLHVGSLIVDDVEDASEVRRGGPACHRVHGQNHAINAGTAAYFLAEPPIWDDDLPADAKLRVYRLYFDALRAGHAGQALDLEGLESEAASAVESGEARVLERQVLAIHRLKTAVPAAMMARVGAILGGGSEAQVEALGNFFEAIGVAFQIVDDVLNLRGFENDLKQRGEDIRQGKVTLPIARALGCLPLNARRWLWWTLRSQPAHQQRTVEKAIDLLESSGVLDDCMDLARHQVESAWQELDPILEDSQGKVMFRAFSWFVLERHY